MNWNKIGAACCTLLFASAAFAQGTPQTEHQNNKETFEALEQQLISVDYSETRFHDVLAELQTQTGLIFKWHESSGDNNLDADSLINLQFNDTRLATVLEFMLDEFQCTWCINDGVVNIVSEDAALDIENQGLMVFNCADLIEKIKPVTVTRRVSASSVRSRGGGFGGGGGVFAIGPRQEDTPASATQQESINNSSADESTEDKTPEKPAPPLIYEETISASAQLMELITETVDPDSWEATGGNGRIVSMNKLYVVRQTTKNLREINMLLDQLRAAGLDD